MLVKTVQHCLLITIVTEDGIQTSTSATVNRQERKYHETGVNEDSRCRKARGFNTRGCLPQLLLGKTEKALNREQRTSSVNLRDHFRTQRSSRSWSTSLYYTKTTVPVAEGVVQL